MFDFTGIGLRETIQKELDKNGVKTEGRDLAGRMSNYLFDSKAVNTNKKYFRLNVSNYFVVQEAFLISQQLQYM